MNASVSVFDPSLGPDPLQGVENENTRHALIHRYLGDIPKAKEFLVKAAYEDDDDLASFLILYSVDSGGGFGFHYDEYDNRLRDRKHELMRLYERNFLPAKVYYKREYGTMNKKSSACKTFHPLRDLETPISEEYPILFVNHMLNFDSYCTNGSYSKNWLCEFGDAVCQFRNWYFTLSSAQCHQPAIRKMFLIHVREGNFRKAMNLQTIRDPLSYQGFEHVDDPLVKYKVGRLYHNRLLILTADEITTDPRPFIRTFKRVKTNCQKAVLYWLWMTKGSIIGKDISLAIAHHLWESRLTDTEDWDFQVSDKKSWWDWGQNFVHNFYFGFK